MALLCVSLASPLALSKGSPSLLGASRAPVGRTRQPFPVLCTATGENDATLVEANPASVADLVASGNSAAVADPKHAFPKLFPLHPPVAPPVTGPRPVPSLGRKSFPDGFTFGAATAAYQIEGATKEDGRGPSIWDTFIEEYPDKVVNRATADVACDSYHRYKDDVRLLKDAGMDAYRFSIAWPRILPNGSLKGGINKKGIKYYNKLIDELIANGITPFVTLFHWDLPQALQDEYGGFLDRQIVEDFKDYCQICFREFGDRVKYWITFNEPLTFSANGFDTGVFSPGRCSKSQGNCLAGDSATEPYKVTHNIILAHATAYRLYKNHFQPTQNGEIGITLNVPWMKPYFNTKVHVEAANRALDFSLGWYLDPLVYGDYPFIMKSLVRERLPCFEPEDSKLVKGSYDFLGINYYSSYYAYSHTFSLNKPVSYTLDEFVDTKVEKEGVLIGELTGSGWIFLCPEGIRDLMVYIKEKYKNPTIYITENGVGQSDNNQLDFEDALDDKDRIKYLALHLDKLHEAIRMGVNVKGYFIWSLMDNFEWTMGYTMRYGLSYVDYDDMQNRYPKDSYNWFMKFLSS